MAVSVRDPGAEHIVRLEVRRGGAGVEPLADIGPTDVLRLRAGRRPAQHQARYEENGEPPIDPGSFDATSGLSRLLDSGKKAISAITFTILSRSSSRGCA